jgi:signal transduction histidine kinase
MKQQKKQSDTKGPRLLSAKVYMARRAGHILPVRSREKLARHLIEDLKREVQSLRRLTDEVTDPRVNHDLKNPLFLANAVLSFAGKDYLRANPKKAFRAIENSKFLIRFARDCIERHQRGISFSPKNIPFSRFVDSTRALGETFLGASEIRFEFQSNLSISNKRNKIFVDEVALTRVVQNLIINAADAIESKGKITIKTKLSKGKLNISVSDTGKGMAAEQIEKFNLGQRFSTKAGGATRFQGVGLSNVRQMVQAHNGIINVQSTLGKGTVFNIEIPTKASH